MRFCTACGRPIDPSLTSPSGSDGDQEVAHPAERRRISVLFVDLVDFTALAESLDPEEVRTIQSRYFEVARSVVATYGGTIEKFIGDAVMAVWGAPAAHEDDAARAVRAALAVVDGVGRLGSVATRGALVARGAVTTGEAAVTIGAVGQGMVAGDLVNTAARLQGEAPPDGVLVDETTRGLAPEAADYEAIGALSFKGRTTALVAFRATPRISPWPGRQRGSHTGPFVGRDRELREIVDLFEGVIRDRRSRLVSVTGIAGVGKSRLAWELGEQLEARPELVAWHAGRAPAYGDEITFAAVAEMVRRRLHIPDGADAELARRQLGSAIGEFVRDEDERRWMEPRLAVLLGGDGLATFDRDELFAAWRRFFERVSDATPTVLVFEDLQWADASLLDFVEHLGSWTRDHAILIIALARPELLDRRPRWGASISRFTALHLERLSDAAMRELLLGRQSNLDDRLVTEVLEHAGGVPLYAVEVVRILADQDGTPHEAGGGRPADDVRRAAPLEPPARPSVHIEVPESLHGLIAARIDALPASERRLLLAAGVLGRRFRLEALVAVSTSDPGVIRERIGGLVRRELLTLDDEPGSQSQGEVEFVQDLVREVAYQTLSHGERRAMHLAAARYLESRPEDELAESLAGHLLEAHRLAPDHPDARRIGRRAVAALRRAAQGALRLHVPERALGHFEQALRLCDGPEQRAVVLEETATAARAAARLDLAEEYLRELVRGRKDAGQRNEAAMARAQLASVMLLAQHNEAAITELESALRATHGFGHSAGGVELASQLARARMLVGDDRGGLEWAERALEAARRLGLETVSTDLLVTRGTARFHLGDEEAGLADLQRAIADAESASALHTELRARNNLAWLIVADDPGTAMATAREAVELATAMGVGDMAVQLGAVACAIAIDTGDWDWALGTAGDLEHQGIAEAHRIDLGVSTAIIRTLRGAPPPASEMDAMASSAAATDPQLLAGVEHARAWASFVAGDFAEARRLAAAAAAASFGAERVHQWTLATRACLWMGARDAAADALRSLTELGTHGRATEAAVATLAAGLAALDGREEARALYRRAGEAWQDLDLPFHRALALLDAHRLLDDGHDPAEASSILMAMGADGLLAAAGAGPAVTPGSALPPPARSRQPSGRYCAPDGWRPSSATSERSSRAAWLISKISGTNRIPRASHASPMIAFARRMASLCWLGSPNAPPLGVTV